MKEKQTQNQILRTFGTRPDVRLWRANAGTASFGSPGSRRTVAFGLRGQADLTGILPGGIRLEIEVKGPNGRQSHEQKLYQQMIERFGGIYVLARSVEDVERVIAAYLTER